MKKLFLVLGIILCARQVSGQVSSITSGGPAQHVVCDSGCVAGGGVSDTDDNSINPNQVAGLGIGLGYAYDNTAGIWKRTHLFALASSNAQAVAIVDASGNQITSFGGGTQYLNGIANGSPTGTLALGYDGSNLRALKTDATGQLNVIGTFFQATQPVSGTFWQATQPISGTVTANQGTANATPWNENLAQVLGNATSTVAAGVQKVGVADSAGTAIPSSTGAPVGSEVGLNTRPITTQRKNSGALTVACLAANINACTAGSTLEVVLDGYTGVSFFVVNSALAGTLIVDYSFDSTLWTSAVIYVSSTTGTATVPASGKDLQVVVAAGTTSTQLFPTLPAGVTKARIRLQAFTAGTTITVAGYTNTTSDPFGLGALTVQVAGRNQSIISTQLVGGSDGTANCTVVGVSVPCLQFFEIRNTALAGTERGLVVQDRKDAVWQCGLKALAATLTQCLAAPAAGIKAYITDITVITTTATAGTYQIRYGTGVNCATGAVALWPTTAVGDTFPAPISSSIPQLLNFRSALTPAAANAICVIGVATNTITIQLQGYYGP